MESYQREVDSIKNNLTSTPFMIPLKGIIKVKSRCSFG